jgi:pyridoxal phosphate enzyme (YggS family)
MEKVNNFKNILTRIQNATLASTFKNKVKLLVVSKKRSVEEIQNIYNLGHRDFGENYVADLVEKYDKLPSDINWHMIGHLQTNKCKKVLKIQNLTTIESVDSLKLAAEINVICEKLNRKVNIYLQINISNEESKSGLNAEEVLPLYEEISTTCPNVVIAGIMSLGTLGSIEEFQQMYKIKEKICEKFSRDRDDFIISMGTSDDFEDAILYGSNEVRLGSIIFEC